MGQTVSNIKESLQQSAEKEKQANDAMNSLQALAKATSDSFYKQIMYVLTVLAIFAISQNWLIMRRLKVIQARLGTDPNQFSR